MTAEAMLKSLDLEKLINKLEEFGLKTSTVITVDNYLLLEDFLIQNWDEVIDAYAPYEMATKRVLKEIIGDANNIAVVDVGWTGSGPLGIKQLIEERWKWSVNRAM